MSPGVGPPRSGAPGGVRLPPDEVARFVDRLVRRVPALDSDLLRSRSAAADLQALTPADVVAVLGLLVRRARDSGPAADTLAAITRALSRGLVDPDHLASCLSAARSLADRLVEALLGTGPAAREYAPQDEQFVDRRLRALSLGERRALSRTRDPDWLSRLAHDQDPRVVRELLRNPRCTEREALIAASRRPTHAPILEEVLVSRFGTSPRVRRAVAHNPYAPMSLALRALSTLPTPALAQLIEDEHVPAEVRRHARVLRVGRQTRPAERAAAPEPGKGEADPALEALLAELTPADDEALPVVLNADGEPRGT